MIINIIKYIENHLIDDELYFHIPDIHGRFLYAIHWSKKMGRNYWHILEKERQSEWRLTTSDFIAFLQTKAIDMRKLEAILTDTIVNQVVMAKLLMEEARKLYGDDILNGYITATEKFYTSLLKVISDMVPKQPDKESDIISAQDLGSHHRLINNKLRVIN